MFQEPVYFAVAVATVLSVAALSAILYRLLGGHQSKGGAAIAGSEDFSPLRLAPMQRLLGSEDFEFLKKQPGYRPEIAAKLRARRVKIFKSYLGNLAAEFHQLHRAIRVLTLHAPTDRSEIARLLVEQRLLFSVRLAQVHIRLAFYAFGVQPADVSALVQTVDAMRQQVQALSASMDFSPSAA